MVLTSNFDPGMQLISKGCRGRSEAGYVQPGLLAERPHTGTVPSAALEPGCHMSQEHHNHRVQLVSDPSTYARCSSALRQRTPAQTAWVSEGLSPSLHFIA